VSAALARSGSAGPEEGTTSPARPGGVARRHSGAPPLPSMVREGTAEGKHRAWLYAHGIADICGGFRRKGAPGDRPAASWEDHEQAAALQVLETEATYGPRPSWYHHAVARRTVATSISRALARVSISEYAVEHGTADARDYQDAVLIRGCGAGPADRSRKQRGFVDVEDASLAPDASLAAQERRQAADRLRAVVLPYLQRLSPQRRAALKLLAGIGGEVEDIAEAAALTGLTTQAVVAARRELKRMLLASPAARRAARNLRDMETP
jgi:hypothetical protein